jgi:ubiquinol-cytochrome c reductase cytochrome b subunit
VTGDRDEHHVLDRPRDRPRRTALGVATLAFYTVLGLAGATDGLSQYFDLSDNNLVWALRVMLLIVPLAAAWFTNRLCLDLQARDGVQADAEPDDEGDAATADREPAPV